MAASEHSRLPHVGDEVRLQCDALVEVASQHPGTPPTWRYLAKGARGRLIGWRDRSDQSHAMVDVTGEERRLIVFLREAAIRPGSAPMSQGRHGA